MDWGKILIELWTYHKGKTIGILLGFFFGLLVVVVGFFQAVFICLCMVVGYYIGRRIDDNIGFHDLFDRVFRHH